MRFYVKYRHITPFFAVFLLIKNTILINIYIVINYINLKNYLEKGKEYITDKMPGNFAHIGLIAAAYSSADSALTSLTTSFCVDLLGFDEHAGTKEIKQRKLVHFGFSILLVLVILVFKAINDDSVISALFKVTGYTYGPLLGMYAFGLFTKINVRDKWVPLVAVLSPVVCYVIQLYIPFGFELLILNGAITFVGLYLLKK